MKEGGKKREKTYIKQKTKQNFSLEMNLFLQSKCGLYLCVLIQ